jgi:putative membrane protein
LQEEARVSAQTQPQSPSQTSPPRTSDRGFWLFNAALSSAALAFLAYILLIRRGTRADVDLSFLPAVNATLNATAASLIVAGWIAIKRGARRIHPYFMVGAFVASALFFVSYSVYHSVHGDTKFLGVGAIRAVYFALLITHVLLSAAVVPMALASFWFSWRKRFATHKKLGRWLVPIWLYVSVTGVAIFFFLKIGR